MPSARGYSKAAPAPPLPTRRDINSPYSPAIALPASESDAPARRAGDVLGADNGRLTIASAGLT